MTVYSKTLAVTGLCIDLQNIQSWHDWNLTLTQCWSQNVAELVFNMRDDRLTVLLNAYRFSLLTQRTGQVVEPVTQCFHKLTSPNTLLLQDSVTCLQYIQFFSAEMNWVPTGCWKPWVWLDVHGCALSCIHRVSGYNGLVSLLVSSFPGLTSLLALLLLWGRTRVVPPLPKQMHKLSSEGHTKGLGPDPALPCSRAQISYFFNFEFMHIVEEENPKEQQKMGTETWVQSCGYLDCSLVWTWVFILGLETEPTPV